MNDSDRDAKVIDRANDLIDSGADLRSALLAAQRDTPTEQPNEEE